MEICRAHFHCFTREQIAVRNNNLDLSWLWDDEGMIEQTLADSDDIVAAIMSRMRSALMEIESIDEELTGEDDTPRRSAYD